MERPLKIVLKLGTSSIINPENGFPFLSNLSRLVEMIVSLRKQGHQVVLVSSGAVGIGLRRLGLRERPKQLSQVQAIAAVGQGRLMSLWDDLFSHFEIPIAQLLLTRHDLSQRSQYLNATRTLKSLLELGALPIINENDTVSSAEIRFGDNDTLSALIAGMIEADWVILLTDVEALYSDNPRLVPDAKVYRVVDDLAAVLKEVKVSSSGGTGMGTGGMQTKLIAAELATSAGSKCAILSSQEAFHIPQMVLHGDRTRGTVFNVPINQKNRNLNSNLEGSTSSASSRLLNDRKWWIKNGLKVSGKILVDTGAVKALYNHHSLLPAGVKGVSSCDGDNHPIDSSGRVIFQANQAVSIICYETGEEVARGLSNFNSMEVQRLIGAHSSAIPDLIGYEEADCIIHRDNIVLFDRK